MELAPYAMRVKDSRGRRFSEPEHSYRSDYQRDRDRVLHCKAFRRLENKTQVFDPAYSDHFRNRLTHTIEVSQISRTISRALGLNTDLCEVLALSHDIGHPPFSHEGERVLDRLMRPYGTGFDHNLHALRIVEDFEEKYAAFRGLNLTFEVREGIVKHSRDYEPEDRVYLDVSAYRLGERPPLEAQLIDLADEIAYNTADLDDGYDSSLLGMERLLRGVTLFREEHGEVSRLHPHAEEKLLVSETVRRMVDRLVTSLIVHSRRRLCEEGIESVDHVRRFPVRLLDFDPEMKEKNRQLKSFLHAELYNHSSLKSARDKASRLLEELFEHYLERPERLPPSHHSRMREVEPHQLVCDYVAGMTDKFAQARYQELRGRSL